MLWGFASVGYRGAHIKVDIVAGLLPAPARLWLDVIAALVLLLFTVLLAWKLLGRVESAFASNEFDLRSAPAGVAVARGDLARRRRLGVHDRDADPADGARGGAGAAAGRRGSVGMSTADLVAVAGFAAMFLMMLARVPIGIAMGLVGVGGFAAIAGWGPALNLLATSPVRTATDYNFSLIPMFVLMGVFATASGMSKELFRAGHAWLGQFRGGLALATIGACGGFAAICGSSVATAATMTNIALPEMRRFGYPDDLATGVIAAGGTLGILIPPSVVLAIYGFMTEQDVGRLFIAGIVPGMLAIVMYMATVRLAYGRTLPAGEPVAWPERFASLRGTWAALLLFIAIIGGIYLGMVTPTEAAAAGAFLTGLIGVLRRRLGGAAIMACLVEALRTTVAIFTILIGALLFGYFLAITQTPQKITSFLVALDLGSYGTLTLILALFVLMGCVLDAMAMIILLVPIVFPVIQTLGFDPIWFGVIIVMTVELGLITPPVGMNVYVINSIVPETSLVTIFRGVAPFILTDLVRLALLVAFPWLVLFLPTTMG